MTVQIIGWTAMIAAAINAIALIKNSFKLTYQDITEDHKTIALFLIVAAICFK